MEVAEALHEASSNAYLKALGATADFVVEVSQEDAADFRQSLQALALQLRESAEPSQYSDASETLTEHLRFYQEKAHLSLQRLHQDMDGAAKAVEAFATGVAAGAAEHKRHLGQEFDRLEVAATGGDVQRIRSTVRGVVLSVTESYDQLKTSHALAIAQMRDEIRTLQAAVEVNRKGMLGEVGAIWGKERLAARVDDFLHRNRQFSMVVIGIGDVATMYSEHARPLIDHVLKESQTGLADLTGQLGVSGIWEEGVFAAILEGPPAPPLALAQQAEHDLSGRYILRLNGTARTIRVDARARTVDYTRGVTAGRFFAALEAAVKEVSGPA